MKHAKDPLTCGLVIGICIEDLGDVELSERKLHDNEFAAILALGALVAKGCGAQGTIPHGAIQEIHGAVGPASGKQVLEYFSLALLTMKSHWKGGDVAARPVIDATKLLVAGDGTLTDNEMGMFAVMIQFMGWEHLL
jgi:hypothetical protein